MELTSFLSSDHLAIRATNQIIMVDKTTIRLEATTRNQNHLVEASLGIANLNPLTFAEGATMAFLTEAMECSFMSTHRLYTTVSQR